MRTSNVIYNYYELIFSAVLLIVFYPTAPSALANLNLAIWWIMLLVLVNEFYNTKQNIKKAKIYWMLELSPKQRRRFSIDFIAGVVFAIAVNIFFFWLVVFA